MKKPVRISEAANRLGLSASTLYHQMRKGHFKAWQVEGGGWVTDSDAIEAYRRDYLGKGPGQKRPGDDKQSQAGS